MKRMKKIFKSILASLPFVLVGVGSILLASCETNVGDKMTVNGNPAYHITSENLDEHLSAWKKNGAESYSFTYSFPVYALPPDKIIEGRVAVSGGKGSVEFSDSVLNPPKQGDDKYFSSMEDVFAFVKSRYEVLQKHKAEYPDVEESVIAYDAEKSFPVYVEIRAYKDVDGVKVGDGESLVSLRITEYKQ